ncbi:hypothetical protein ACTMQ2_18085 [Pseudomonas syringae pv. aptata]|nr:hypothetical protein [Pseudomonas syringae]MCK0548668.1 hypothetical protein [Pseudomonas syringae pv. aptata]
MKTYRPYGPAPTKLEADILKLRALEMVLVLFYVEELKQYILKSLEMTARVLNEFPSLPKKNKMEAARSLLVSEGCITQADADELRRLIDYRNTIGHEIHRLVFDIGSYSELGTVNAENLQLAYKYDFSAARAAASLAERVSAGMSQKLCSVIGLNALRFDAAERVYLAEIRRLKNKINSGLRKHRTGLEKTQSVIDQIPVSVINSAQPRHPMNLKANGALTHRGMLSIFQLFEAGATSIAAAYIMRISARSAALWYKKWYGQLRK